MRAKALFSSSRVRPALPVSRAAGLRRWLQFSNTRMGGLSCTIISAIMVLFLSSSSSEQQNAVRGNGYSYVENEKLTNQIIFLTYDDQFNEAIQLVDAMIKEDSKSMQWKYFRVMILWRKLVVHGWGTGKLDQSVADEIGKELLALRKTTDSVTHKSSRDVKALFYAGAIYGYLGMYYVGIKDEPFKAISVGNDGMDFHKRVLQLDPTCYDAYYSLGVYNYYASSVPWYLKPFLFVFGMSGSEEKAESYLRLVVDKGVLAKYEAAEMLANLYERQKKFDSAAAIYRGLAERFPNAGYRYYLTLWRICTRSKGEDEMVAPLENAIKRSKIHQPREEDAGYVANIYLILGAYFSKIGKNDEAVSLYKEALARRLGYHDWLCYYLGRAYEKLGDKTLAIQSYQSVKQDGLTKEAYQKVQERLKELLKSN